MGFNSGFKGLRGMVVWGVMLCRSVNGSRRFETSVTTLSATEYHILEDKNSQEHPVRTSKHRRIEDRQSVEIGR